MKLVNGLKILPLCLALVACGASESDPKKGSPAAALDNAPCVNNVGGSWKFGVAPDGCDSNSYGSDAAVQSKYSSLVFDETKNSAAETERYVSNMSAFLGEVSEIYFKQRKRTAQDEELRAWKRSILAMAHQESYWTHYRISKLDGRLKFMRGDSGHGYGLMQVDDRWHKGAINKGSAWDILPHALYTMDMFYKVWNMAAKAPCVTSLEDRSRSAYSMYNGGFSRACR